MTTEHFDADYIHTTTEGQHFRHGDGQEADGEGNQTETGFVATCYLSNDGCSGPKETIPTTIETAVADAIAWAEGQIGHPWDCILVNVYVEGKDVCGGSPFETHQIEYRDGAWECV
jgi:hypothetical protein